MRCAATFLQSFVEEEITLSQPTVRSPLITFDSARKEDLLPEARRKGPASCGYLWMLLMRVMVEMRGLQNASAHVSEDGCEH